ncbi:XRE family transcriptional regulator [Sphingobium sp. LB126]|uniref:helix-turn-helix domain-containing protein n=1 Tax=Sphingobium sp. LB126 TaxID=1983755 RepID=UPI003221CAA4
MRRQRQCLCRSRLCRPRHPPLKAQLVTLWPSHAGAEVDADPAAKVTGSTQPELSRILRGQFRSVSVERLLAMLTRLGCKVDIVVRPQGRTTESAVIHFA